jgi:hypothetical protein
MVTPALGVTTSIQEDVTSFDLEAPDGYYITSVYLNNIEPDYVASVTFDNYGNEYTLDINTTKSNVLWWTFDVSLTYPNSSVVTTSVTTSRLATDSDIKIQYFYSELDSVLDIDLYVGMLPLYAGFEVPISSGFDGSEDVSESLLYTRMAFSEVSGTCSSPFDLKVYISDPAEFAAQQEESLSELLTGSAELFTSWVWNNVIAFIEKIPGIGPYLADSLEFTAMLIDNVFFYFRLFFIDYLATTLLTIEFFILSKAIITTRKNANIFALLDKIITAHVDTFEFVVDTISKMISMFSALVHMIAAIVSAIKPI